MDTEPLPQAHDPEAERNDRIRELEARLARPARQGVAPWVAASALVISCGLIWWTWPETAYFFSSHQPIQLGAEGDYRFDQARDNLYVELHGIPTARGAFGQDGSTTVVAVGVRDTPVMIWRKALKGEEWTPGNKAPPPNQQPFTVRGRLLARASATDKYREAFDKIEGQGEINPKWVLVESARPGGDFLAAALFAFLMALAGFNAWLLVRGVLALRRSAGRSAS